MTASRSPLLHILFFLSGLAGLGYQIVWTGQFAIGLGHEIPSLLAVVAAFFGGLAVGAGALDRRISSGRTPGRWYAVLEILIGVWALLTIVLIPWLNGRLASFIGVDPSPGRHWAIAFVVPFVALLPATAAMGATLPAMDRFVARWRSSGRSIGGVYAANTLGAMAGTLISTFLLLPSLGFRATLASLAAVNFLCGIAVLLGPARGEHERAPVQATIEDVDPARRLLLIIFCTGLFGIGYEVMAVRVMAQVLENTVYSYASALSVYLFATAVGAALYQWIGRRFAYSSLLTALLQATTFACLIGIFLLWQSDAIYRGVRNWLGHDLGGSIGAEMILAAAVFLLPSLLMGATFSHLAQGIRGRKGGVGIALCINTVGGSCAPLLFGVALLPVLGAKTTLVIISLGYLMLVPEFRPRVMIPSAVAIGLVFLLPSSLRLVEPVPGGRVIDYREGVMASVAVVDDAEGDLYLKVNNRFRMGGTKSGFAERRQSHIPMLLHPAPERVLLLGIGTGATLGAAVVHPDVEVVAVELVPEVVEVIGLFGDVNENAGEQSNLEIVVSDARRFVRAADDEFDVIVADLFHPARDGSGWLYTVEHFEAIRDLLAPGGIFCQWVPLYQVDDDMCRVIVRTFLSVFPEVQGFVAHYNARTPLLGLIGGETTIGYPPNWYEQRVSPALRNALIRQEQALYDDFALFGCLLADRALLEAFAGEGPLNTDDRPLIRFGAPQYIYADMFEPEGRLLTFLGMPPTDPIVLMDEPDDPDSRAFADRLAAFIVARDHFLRASMHRNAGNRTGMLEALLQAVEASPDFGTAYVISIQEALSYERTNPSYARRIFERLRELRPDRPEAAQHLQRMDNG